MHFQEFINCILLHSMHGAVSSGSTLGETNVQGEEQKKLDVIANELFINMLKSSFEVMYILC